MPQTSYNSDLVHARKTITFDGTAGKGATGTAVTIFTQTGRTLIERLTAFITSPLTGALAEYALGWPGATGAIGGSNVTAANADWNLLANWANGVYGPELIQLVAGGDLIATSGNLILTPSVANITGGVVIFDVWYRPITDNGSLA